MVAMTKPSNKGLELTAYSARCAPAFGSSSGLAFAKREGTMPKSFEPIASPSARVIVLGTMPGRISMETGEYYANSRNLFWPFMCELFSLDASLPYSERCRLLSSKGVAVWDVLASAVRTGSLDASIIPGSERPNDFHSFFSAHPMITTVFFNGAMAERMFSRLVLPKIGSPFSGLALQLLPSTSPANTKSRSAKLEVWRMVAQAVKG